MASRTVQLYGDPDGPGPAGFELMDAVLVTVTADGVVVPATPSGLVAHVASPTQVNLDWSSNAESGVTYHVYRGTTAGFTPDDAVNRIAANLTSSRYLDSSLTMAGIYYYKVKAIVGGVASASTAQVRVDAGPIPPAPTSPSDLTVTAATSNSVTLTWNDHSSNETGFAVERWNSTTEEWDLVGQVAANQTDFTDTGLSADTVYRYRVAA